MTKKKLPDAAGEGELPPRKQVYIDTDLHLKAEQMFRQLGSRSIPDYVSNRLRKIIEVDWEAYREAIGLGETKPKK